mmetsp:Transcript_8374/g.24116  ORF Transcript_8374/g.24116 Transcript_8374/m.24116 type:complete len:281 (-) Transcript_8374:529-1371(-)
MLDLAGALVYFRYSGIAVVPFGRHLGNVPHATQNLNGLVTAHGGSFARGKFCHCGLAGVGLLGILQLRRAPRQQTGGITSDGHRADLVLNRLQIRNWLSECISLQCVLDCAIDGGGGDAQCLSRNSNPAAIQCAHGDLESHAFIAEQATGRDTNIFEDQIGRARCSDSEFVFLGSETESFDVHHRHDECRNSLVLETLVSRREDDRRTGLVGVGDPRLRAVDDPIIAVLGGGRGSGSRIAAVAGLTQSKAADFHVIVAAAGCVGCDPLVMLRRRSECLHG